MNTKIPIKCLKIIKLKYLIFENNVTKKNFCHIGNKTLELASTA